MNKSVEFFKANTQVIEGEIGVYQPFASMETLFRDDNNVEKQGGVEWIMSKVGHVFYDHVDTLDKGEFIHDNVILPHWTLSEVMVVPTIGGGYYDRFGFIRDVKLNKCATKSRDENPRNHYRKIKGLSPDRNDFDELFDFLRDYNTWNVKKSYIFGHKKDLDSVDFLENDKIECTWLPKGILFISNNSGNMLTLMTSKKYKTDVECVEGSYVVNPKSISLTGRLDGVFIDIKPDEDNLSNDMSETRLKELNDQSVFMKEISDRFAIPVPCK